MKPLKRLEDLPEVLRRRDLHDALPLGRNNIDALLKDQRIRNIVVNRQRLIPKWAVLTFLGFATSKAEEPPVNTCDMLDDDLGSGNRRRRRSNNSSPGPHRR